MVCQMQFPVGANDAELEERMIQHLAAAAAMGQRHFARREGQRNRLPAQGCLQFLVFSSLPNGSAAGSISSSPTQREGEPVSTITGVSNTILPNTWIFSTTNHTAIFWGPGWSSSASASGFSVPNQHGNSMENWCSNRSIVTLFFFFNFRLLS